MQCHTAAPRPAHLPSQPTQYLYLPPCPNRNEIHAMESHSSVGESMSQNLLTRADAHVYPTSVYLSAKAIKSGTVAQNRLVPSKRPVPRGLVLCVSCVHDCGLDGLPKALQIKGGQNLLRWRRHSHHRSASYHTPHGSPSLPLSTSCV